VADFNQINQFGSVKPVRSGEGTSCAECEAMLMDALDGTLTAKQQAAFDRHIATCAECGQMLADARRGATLLEILKSPRPEPSSLLLDRIIAQTSGAHVSSLAELAKGPASGVVALPNAGASAANATLDIHAVVPVTSAPGNVIPFRPRAASRFSLKAITQTMMQPRLAMTAAMAFFSITLTLNLTGVHLTDLRASDLTPANLKHSFFHANASVVRYYENLRVVYELESRLNEFKRSSDSDNPPAARPDTKEDSGKTPDGNQINGDKPRKAPKSGSGTSQRRNPLGPEFRLTEYNRDAFAPRQGIGSAALAADSNKLKETRQEGDLV
jgi:hypothetical protein